MKIGRSAMIVGLVLALAVFSSCAGKSTSTGTTQALIDAGTPTLSGTPNPSGMPLPGSTPNGTDPSASAQAGTPTPYSGEEEPGVTPVPKRTLAEYKALNPDVIGWLKVANTNIDYPVARTNNNDYYLDHNVEKGKSKSGTIFMDYRNADKYQQRHLIIYGHNMKNGTMFHDLRNYKQKEFFDNNKKITLTLNGKEMQFQVYAAFIAEVDKVNFTTTQFGGAADFAQYMNQLAKLSKFTSGVKITEKDQVLTLSTCTYETNNSRFVVQAKRIK